MGILESILRPIVLGLVQGLTEFLPISSSGHLIVLPKLFGWPDQGLAFDLFLHLGTLLAILILFWKDWLGILKGIVFIKNKQYSSDRKLLLLILIGILPALIFGLCFGDLIGEKLRLPWLVGANLIFWALVLWVADIYTRKREHTTEVNKIKPKHAIITGLFQAIALIPGGSRSGLSITGGLFAGMSRKAAVKFSFMMSAPLILGAALLKGIEWLYAPHMVPWARISISPMSNQYDLIVGFIFAFISGLLAIKLLNYIATRKNFLPFVIYRIIIGTLIILFL